MKITIVESKAKKFEEVQIREPVMKDLINAERISGASSGIYFITTVISLTALFDGQSLPPEELEEIGLDDFLDLFKISMELGLEKLVKQSFFSQGTPELNSSQSLK